MMLQSWGDEYVTGMSNCTSGVENIKGKDNCSPKSSHTVREGLSVECWFSNIQNH